MLLVTLVLLVVLSTLGYTLSGRVAAQRHRDRYIIDYQAARYGCDSAVKYALATLEDINSPQLVARPDEPDFSDLFILSEAKYEELLAELAAKSRRAGADGRKSFYDTNDINDANYVSYVDANAAEYTYDMTDFNDPNFLTIRGPYGSPWPSIIEPVEFEIASATVSIEIEDENAKYPIGWALLDGKNVRRQALAGLQTFCEWMDVNEAEIDSLKSQMDEISEIKTFKLDFKPIKIVEKEVRTRRRRGRRRRRYSRMRRVHKTLPASIHTADFAKLFHSSLIDIETLARPTIISESRKESALKYMGVWASSRVNINTAPRHVLEAAFTFGGDEVEIAEGIIRRRRIRPFTDIEDLRKSLLKYSDSIRKCEKYITTVSRFFTIRVTAVSGVAEASAIIAIKKDGKKLERIAVISG